MNPRADDHFDHSQTEPSAELTLGFDARPATAADEDQPFNMTMYLKYLPGTD
ncbi:MAG: hypothetical protein ACXWUX_15895 [Allosphingosinicella sp.]